MACADVENGCDCLNRDSLRGEELTRADQCQVIQDMIVGKADVVADGVKVVEMAAGKRRRGRPPRNQGKVDSSSTAAPQRENKAEEDVCFICFDGGNLVLCDRRGCPKAYHPACIKRDETFFKSKSKWNCGWHICSTCQKASHYMCYTCTYSLCKNCTKDADYVNVRGNKGFCGLCRGTIMMIESTALGTKEMVQVDFDDQTSWEYLFKIYWILLKEKLSLSLSELIKAKNPWKEIAKGASSERSFGDLGASYSKRRKTMIQQKFLNKVEPLEAENSVVMKGMPLPEEKNCASEKGHTKEYSLLLNMKGKDPASPLKGGDILSDIGSRESSITLHSTETELSVNIETDKIWHYQDPLGKIHGPFPMAMLRKWSTSGLLPPDLRIWRTNERIEDSILLTDVLTGRYSQLQQFHKICVPTKDVRLTPNYGYQDRVGDVRESWDLNVDQMESKQVERSLNSMENDANGLCCSNIESTTSQKLGSQSSCTAPLDIATSNAVQSGSPLPHGDSVKGDNYFSSKPLEGSSLQSSTFSGKPCETQSHLVITGHGVEKWDCGSINLNENSNKTSEGQFLDGNVKQDGTVGKSDKSCGQSWRSPLNNASSEWDPNCGLISLAMALEAAEHNHDIDFPDLPSSTSKLNLEDSKPQSTKNKQPLLSSSALHQDSGPSWSTASSLVCNEPLLSEVAGEWGGNSSTPAKLSVEKRDLDLVPESSMKRPSLGSDHAATPSSGSGQLAHSSLTDPAENASGWDPIIPDPDEYSFGDESVSDLLAEVEAMESLNGLTSPASILHCDGELAQGAELDCFSPACDPGKSDVLSSTNDLRMSSQSIMTNETIGASESEVIDAQKRSGRNSSTCAEMDKDKWSGDISVNRYQAGSDMLLPAPAVATWGMATIDTTWSTGRETTAPNWEAIHGNLFFNLGGSGQGARNFSWGTGQGTIQDNGNINLGTYWGNQPEGLDFQGRDSSLSRFGSSMHSHSTYNVPPNGVGSFRPPPKGQRICKFYERGDCKKGSSCSYWHP